MNDSASSSEIPVIPVRERIPVGSGIWCVPRSLVGLTHRLTPTPHISCQNSRIRRVLTSVVQIDLLFPAFELNGEGQDE